MRFCRRKPCIYIYIYIYRKDNEMLFCICMPSPTTVFWHMFLNIRRLRGERRRRPQSIDLYTCCCLYYTDLYAGACHCHSNDALQSFRLHHHAVFDSRLLVCSVSHRSLTRCITSCRVSNTMNNSTDISIIVVDNKINTTNIHIRLLTTPSNCF